MLALGGGGARGFAHIGVLETLARHRLTARAVVGTSMGAVVAAMYLAHGSTERVRQLWQEALARQLLPVVGPIRAATQNRSENPLLQVARTIRNRLVVSIMVNRRTLLDGEASDRAVDFLVPDIAIEDLHPPLVVVATDLADGAAVCLDRGPLRAALRASTAIPGVLPPVRFGNRLLVDGGVVAEIPVAQARAVGWPVVAVDVSMDLTALEPELLVLDTMMRTGQLTSRHLRTHQLTLAREVVRPEVGHAVWSDWHRIDELVEAGRRAAVAWLGLSPPSPFPEPPDAERAARADGPGALTPPTLGCGSRVPSRATGASSAKPRGGR